MSHLACADEDSAGEPARSCEAFIAVAGKVRARRLSLANSAGICLGADYAFGLTRPGLALYGGVPRREAKGHIRQVARVEAQIVQRRRVEAGGKVGYGGTFTAEAACELLILNIGYADGYLRGFSSRGRAKVAGKWAPVVGRVSMDLTAIRIDPKADVAEGDWVELDYDLPEAAVQSGLSQYELLTTLGNRFKRTLGLTGDLAHHLIFADPVLGGGPAFGRAVERLVIGAVRLEERVEIRARAPDVEGEVGAVLGPEQFRPAIALAAREELRPGPGRRIGRLEGGPRLLLHLVTPHQRDHALCPIESAQITGFGRLGQRVRSGPVAAVSEWHGGERLSQRRAAGTCR